MKGLRRVLAWITIIVIVGLVITTFVLGISGSAYTFGMLGITMGISVLLWVLLWFMKILENRNNNRVRHHEKEPHLQPAADMKAEVDEEES